MNNVWEIVLVCVLIFMFTCVLIFVVGVYVREYWKFLDVPHERPKPILATLKIICCYCTKKRNDNSNEENEEHYRRLYYQFRGSGPFCGFYDVMEPRLLVLDRELVKQILIKDFSNFNDHGVYSNPRYDPISGDLYSRNGNSWQEMRHKLHPHFTVGKMDFLFEQISAQIDELLEHFARLQQPYLPARHVNSVTIKMYDPLRHFVLSNIAKCVFGLSTPLLQQSYPLEEFEEMAELALTAPRYGSIVRNFCRKQPALSRRLGLGATNVKAANYFRSLLADVVEQRENEGDNIEPHKDYLQLLIDIKTEELSTHEADSSDARNLRAHLHNELVAHAFTFLRMGYHSVAQTLTYTILELAANEDIQNKVRDEVEQMLAKHNNEWNRDVILGLVYLGQVIAETVRLHPTQPYLIRRTLEDYRLPNYPKYVIRKNMLIIIPIDAMHHDPINYPDPDIMRPERFSLEECRQRDQGAWLGYGAGPRHCIGFFYSQLQIRVAIARLLLHHRFRLLNPEHGLDSVKTLESDVIMESNVPHSSELSLGSKM